MAEKQAVIEAERLRLVPLAAEHADDVVKLFADPAMSTYLGVDLSQGGLARTMVDNRLAYEGPPELGHWVILQQDRVIGLAHLRPTRELPGGLAEIGWYLGTRYGGVGLATEAARALLRHGAGRAAGGFGVGAGPCRQRSEPARGRTSGVPPRG